MHVILNNYTRATKTIQMQKSELELLNSEMSKANDELKYLNASKDKFFSIIAHDLRGPMGSLLSLSGNLAGNLNSLDKEKIEMFVLSIHRSQQKTFNLLEELLLWAKSQSGTIPFEPVKISIKQVCSEITKEKVDIALYKNIALRCNLTDSLYLNADPNMLRTVLRNLLSNALKFTNESGTISISSDIDGDSATIIVSDTGVGISSDKLSTLWDIGHNSSTMGTEGELGTGLGLILCKEFVEKHRGRIWAESIPGAGSDFKFTMPIFL
jgi:signal transduction histidine kinase